MLNLREIKATSIITKSNISSVDYVINSYVGCTNACVYKRGHDPKFHYPNLVNGHYPNPDCNSDNEKKKQRPYEHFYIDCSFTVGGGLRLGESVAIKLNIMCLNIM